MESDVRSDRVGSLDARTGSRKRHQQFFTACHLASWPSAWPETVPTNVNVKLQLPRSCRHVTARRDSDPTYTPPFSPTAVQGGLSATIASCV